jgi:hypothetical protein
VRARDAALDLRAERLGVQFGAQELASRRTPPQTVGRRVGIDQLELGRVEPDVHPWQAGHDETLRLTASRTQ